MDLIELRLTIRRWWVAGVITFLLLAIACSLALPKNDRPFAASTTLLVTPRAERFETVSTGVLRILLPNVLVRARSRDVRQAVGERLGELGDEPVDVDATFTRDSGVMKLTARARSSAAAVIWSVELANELVDRHEADEYLILEVIDPARSARAPRPLDWIVDYAGIAVLSLFGSTLTMFALERLRESGDVVSRIRAGGQRVLAELAVPVRGARPSFSKDPQASRLALALTAAPGVESNTRFVIASNDARSTFAVVDALRTGLHRAGLHGRHEVVAGPSLDELADLRAETHGDAGCVAVLDSMQRVDTFVDQLDVLREAGVPIIGVVVTRRGLRRGSRSRTPHDERAGATRLGV